MINFIHRNTATPIIKKRNNSNVLIAAFFHRSSKGTEVEN